MTKNTTLSQRGVELLSRPRLREKFEGFLKAKPYDPETCPDGFVNMGVAENYAMLGEVTEHVTKNLQLDNVNFSYGEGPWGSRRLRKAVAKFMTRQMSAVEEVHEDDIMVANGITVLCEMLGLSIGDPGDGILFPRPIYQAFKLDFITTAKVESIFVSFDDVDAFSPGSAAEYEKALKKAEQSGMRVRALMLCNPHNPLGQCYPKETIIEYMKLCQKYKIHLLSDEVYAASVYDVPDKHALPFTSVLSFDSSSYIDPDYLHVLYGMSKDFAAGGTRLGFLHTRNKELMIAMSCLDPFHWSGGINEKVALTILEDEKWLDNFLKLAKDRLSARNTLTREMLDKAGIKYHRGANAGFFLWVDLRPFLPQGPHFPSGEEQEAELTKRLMDERLFMTNGLELSAKEAGWFRVIFAQEEATMKEGLRRLFKVIGKLDEYEAASSVDKVNIRE